MVAEETEQEELAGMEEMMGQEETIGMEGLEEEVELKGQIEEIIGQTEGIEQTEEIIGQTEEIEQTELEIQTEDVEQAEIIGQAALARNISLG